MTDQNIKDERERIKKVIDSIPKWYQAKIDSGDVECLSGKLCQVVTSYSYGNDITHITLQPVTADDVMGQRTVEVRRYKQVWSLRVWPWPFVYRRWDGIEESEANHD